MGLALAEIALLECDMGLTPCPLLVEPESLVMTDGLLVATVLCGIPFLNVISFGMCISEENPMVIAMILASLGADDSAPCIPMTFDPWITTAPTTLVGGMPIIDDMSILECLWGGTIITVEPEEFFTMVP